MALRCDYIYLSAGGQLECQFQEGEKIYETERGNFCIYHLPIEDKKKLLTEREIEDFKNALIEVVIAGGFCAGVQVPGHISFGQDEIHGIDFSDGVFEENADFGATKIFGHAIFKNTIFKRFARFKMTQFHAYVDFTGAKFMDYANFKESVFADIEPAIKGDTNAVFDGAVFEERAEFSNSIFKVSASFKNCTFGVKPYSYISFKNARFHGPSIDFSNSLFRKDTDFGITSSKEEADRRIQKAEFSNVIFEKKVSFDNRIFCASTKFDNAIFKKPPRFFNTTFYEDTDIHSARFPDICSEDSARAYQILKRNFDDISMRNEAVRFHILEQRALRKQKNTPVLYKFVSWLDDITSRYGYRAFRPFICLIVLPFIFMLIYFIFLSIFSGTGSVNIGNCLDLSIKQIIEPFKIWSQDTVEVLYSYKPYIHRIFKIIASINSLFMIFFSGIFITALKRQFNRP